MAIGMGAIALSVGILILCGIPGLSSLGTIGGSLFSTVGTLIVLAGICLQCVTKSDQQGSERPTQEHNPGPRVDSQRKGYGVIADEARNVSKGQTASTPDQIKGQNNIGSIDFSKITPANYEQYLDVSNTLDWKTGKKGDFVFTKGVHDKDNIGTIPPYKCKKGDPYLNGEIRYEDKGQYSGGDLEICNGEFIHYPQMSAPAERFSNLKDFFDYMFRGEFYQGECTSRMEFFTLKTIDGKEVRYNNPYKE